MELPDDAPDSLPDDIRDWLEQDYGDVEWASATFHGSSDGDWSLEIFYDDDTSESINLGTFDGDPDEWVWDLFDWLDYEVDGDVDVDYTEI